MTIEEIVRAAFEQGAAVGLAIFAILMLRGSYQERMRDLKEHEDRRAEDRARLESLHRETLMALTGNTQALTELSSKLWNNHRRRSKGDEDP